MFAKSLTKSGVTLKHINMKSRITIDVDSSNQPIIKIEYKESEDVRDKLVKRFLEGFGSESTFANFFYEGNNSTAILVPIGGKAIVDILTRASENFYQTKDE